VKHLARLVVVASAAACAIYTLVYLARWEWHRAIVAALFLVVVEVGIVGATILRRLIALDQRLTALSAAQIPPAATAPPPSPGAAAPWADGPRAGASRHPAAARPVNVSATTDILQRVRETAPPRRPVFAWLAPDRTGVFLPILLGAGVLASALAWVVEGLARMTARPVLEERLATRLGVLALPAGGLLGPAPAYVDTPRRSARWQTRAGYAGLVLLAAGALTWGYDALADATQTRPESTRPDVTTVVELQLYGEVAGAAPEKVVTSLWHTCAGTVHRTDTGPALTDLGGNRFRLEVPGDFGLYTARRVHGCLEDAALDRVQAGVVSFRAVPTASRAPGSSGPEAGPETAGRVEHPAGGH
jgi:hypothetical protein